MLHFTVIVSLLATAASAQLVESNLKMYVGSLALSANFNPIREAYWTGLSHRRTPFAVLSFAAVGNAITATGAK
jgi:hypothetical protein